MSRSLASQFSDIRERPFGDSVGETDLIPKRMIVPLDDVRARKNPPRRESVAEARQKPLGLILEPAKETDVTHSPVIQKKESPGPEEYHLMDHPSVHGQRTWNGITLGPDEQRLQ